MALEHCKNCYHELLTEADPYGVYPHYTGYHILCQTCFTTQLRVFSKKLSQLPNNNQSNSINREITS